MLLCGMGNRTRQPSSAIHRKIDKTMRHFRPRHAAPGLLPVLYEALLAESLWSLIYQFEHPENGMPCCDDVATTVLNDDNEERSVIPLWTRQEYAEQYRLGWDSPFRERILCVQSVYGANVLKRLAKRNVSIVIDHGYDGLILRSGTWQPALAFHGQTGSIEFVKPEAVVDGWCAADPDDFPAWRDRLTHLLLNIETARRAWLLWLPVTAEAPRRLCLVTMSALPDVASRIYHALPLLAQDLTLPPLAYLPLHFGDKLARTLSVPAFFGDELEHALKVASGKPASRMYRLF